MIFMIAACLSANATDTAARDPGPRVTGSSTGAANTPVNLRVLSKSSSPAEIEDLMNTYNRELGVTCDYCHSQDPRTRKLDYASDDNPAKQTARVMIAMLEEINSRYLSQLDDSRYAVLVTCGNCHQGRADPPVFEPREPVTNSVTAGGR
jgi:hypothetical protein